MSYIPSLKKGETDAIVMLQTDIKRKWEGSCDIEILLHASHSNKM